MKNKNKSKKKNCIKPIMELSVRNAGSLPDTAFDMVNRYGTYEIQSTADTENQYPAIAQGYNPKIEKRDGENSHHGGKWETE